MLGFFYILVLKLKNKIMENKITGFLQETKSKVVDQNLSTLLLHHFVLQGWVVVTQGNCKR